MKRFIAILLLAVLLSASIAACSNDASPGSSPDHTPIADTSAPAAATSIPAMSPSDSKAEKQESPLPSDSGKKASAAAEAYKDVLLNKLEYISTDDQKKKVLLKDFLTNEAIYATAFKVTHFTVVDMDGDRMPEVVLELSPGENPEFYEVLHYMDGEVYGYIQVYRGMENLKTDGSFRWASSAFRFGYGKLRFGPDAYECVNLGYMDSNPNDKAAAADFIIGDKPVTEEAYQQFVKEQDAKKDAVWQDFSQENIAAGLTF